MGHWLIAGMLPEYARPARPSTSPIRYAPAASEAPNEAGLARAEGADQRDHAPRPEAGGQRLACPLGLLGARALELSRGGHPAAPPGSRLGSPRSRRPR